MCLYCFYFSSSRVLVPGGPVELSWPLCPLTEPEFVLAPLLERPLGLSLQPSSKKNRLVCTGNCVSQQSLTFAFAYLGFKRSSYLIHPRNDLSIWGNTVPIAHMASSESSLAS